jgi:hypothetical protein
MDIFMRVVRVWIYLCELYEYGRLEILGDRYGQAGIFVDSYTELFGTSRMKL